MDANNIIAIVSAIFTLLGVFVGWATISKQNTKARETAAITIDKLTSAVSNIEMALNKHSLMYEAMKDRQGCDSLEHARRHGEIVGDVKSLDNDVESLKKNQEKLEKTIEKIDIRIDEITVSLNDTMKELSRTIKELLQYRREQK